MVAVIFQLLKMTAFTMTTKAIESLPYPIMKPWSTLPAPVKRAGLAVLDERVRLGIKV